MVTIAHRSGGPAADIVVPLPDGRVTGFLAETPEEYAEVMARVFGSKDDTINNGEVEKALQVGEGSGACSNIGSMLEHAMGGGCGDGVGGFSTQAVRVAARESARRFSNEVFDNSFAAEFAVLLESTARHRESEKKE